MAGKHVGTLLNAFNMPGSEESLASQRPNFPGSRIDRAYAEGRQSLGALANPYVIGTAEFLSFGGGAFFSQGANRNNLEAIVHTGVTVP